MQLHLKKLRQEVSLWQNISVHPTALAEWGGFRHFRDGV